MIHTLLLACAVFAGDPIAKSPVTQRADTAVLLMDYQRDLVEPDGAWHADVGLSFRTLAATDTLLATAHRRGWPVLRVVNDFPRWDVVGNWIRHGAAVHGRPGARMVPAVDALTGPVYDKYWPNAFSNRELSAWSDGHPRATIWVAGFFANGCVLHTARGAMDRGHPVLSMSHLVAAPDSTQWRKGWDAMVKAGVREMVRIP